MGQMPVIGVRLMVKKPRICLKLSSNLLGDNGKYTVKFRAFTEDNSGIVDGSYSFTVAVGGAASSSNAANATEVGTNLPPTAPATGTGGAAVDNNSVIVIIVLGLAVLGLGAVVSLIALRQGKRN